MAYFTNIQLTAEQCESRDGAGSWIVCRIRTQTLVLLIPHIVISNQTQTTHLHHHQLVKDL